MSHGNSNPFIRVEVATGTAFGGLAAVGINCRVRRTRDGLVITRSWIEIAIGMIGILGFALVPLYFIGVDGIKLIFAGDFNGERLFVAISLPLLVLVAILFMKSAVLRRPLARVSRKSRSIDYQHRGYSEMHIGADEITAIRVEKREGASSLEHMGRDYAYAVCLRLSNGNDVAIATHRSEEQMQQLAKDVAKVLDLQTALQS